MTAPHHQFDFGDILTWRLLCRPFWRPRPPREIPVRASSLRHQPTEVVYIGRLSTMESPACDAFDEPRCFHIRDVALHPTGVETQPISQARLTGIRLPGAPSDPPSSPTHPGPGGQRPAHRAHALRMVLQTVCGRRRAPAPRAGWRRPGSGQTVR